MQNLYQLHNYQLATTILFCSFAQFAQFDSQSKNDGNRKKNQLNTKIIVLRASVSANTCISAIFTETREFSRKSLTVHGTVHYID